MGHSSRPPRRRGKRHKSLSVNAVGIFSRRSQGFGAGLIALLAALGRQADDVARFAGRHADDLGRVTFQQADDLGRATLSGSDDLLRGADGVVHPWVLPESRITEPQAVGSVNRHVAGADDRGSDVLWHIARETGEEALKMAIKYDKENE